MKTLKLLNPEWQGYGKDNRISKGASALRATFSESCSFTELELPHDENIIMENGVLGKTSILKNIGTANDILYKENPERVFMIGGSCGSELVPVSYLNQLYKGNLAVLWFDAHGDLNTPESSPSGHFHGMILRTLLGDGDPGLRTYIKRPLISSQVTLAGVRQLDQPESDYIHKSGLHILSSQDLLNPDLIIRWVNETGLSNIYIHLDLDVLDPDDFKGSLFKEDGGITINQMIPVLSKLNSEFTIAGLSVVECASVNPEHSHQIHDLLKKSGLQWVYEDDS